MESDQTSPVISRIILFVKDPAAIANFYQRYFHMRVLAGASDEWVELTGSLPGCNIALHKATVSQKSGSAIKIVFGVKDVRSFKAAKEADGLSFGVIHKVEDFEFCNGKDPAGNSIQISSRGLV